VPTVRRRSHAATSPGRSSRVFLAIVVVGLTGCGGYSGSAPGLIAFSGHPRGELGDGYNNILVMNSDGTGVRRLTRTDGDIDPSWSPDGRQVAYTRATTLAGCDFDPACAQIWIVDADGVNARPLTPPAARSEAPDWSPDGKRIVFQQWNVPYDYDPGSIDIYVMNVDGSGVRQLTYGPGASESPEWTADGEQIVFAREVDGDYETWVMNADGSNPERLTQLGALSPDGKKIVTTRQSDDDLCPDIVVMNADGSEARRLLSPEEGGSDLAWSPDSSQIAFIHCVKTPVEPDVVGSEIWVMDADGGNAHALPAGPYASPWGLDWAAAP
jgi:Tol biopolymer transport system component